MKRLSIVTAAILMAAIVALGISALDPDPAAGSASGSKVRKCGGGKISLNANEKRVFNLHNKARKQKNLRVLCVHPKLKKAARSHSRDMLDRGYFAHGDTGARLKRHGYRWRIYGENIGHNDTSPQAMHRSWMNSSDHRKNILDRRFREIGVGAVRGDFQGSSVVMYTVDFGTR
ncbi:MAG: CAP domain-containing protein [Rubrobacteraceae bacterium]